MKILLILSILFSSAYLFSQKSENDIIYDIETRNFIDKVKKIKKNDKGEIFLKYYNPFTHKNIVTAENINNIDNIVPFVIRIFSGSFSISPALSFDSSFLIDNSPGISNLKKFNTIYTSYLKLIGQIKKEYYDCNEINKILLKINSENSIIDLYNKLTKPEKDKYPNLKLPNLINLLTIKENIEKYKSKIDKDCNYKVAKYSATGSSVAIKIELTPREESSTFGFPLDIITAKKNIEVKNVININFSSGIMATNNIQPDYYVKENTTENYIILTENRGKIMPGVNSLMHLNYSKSNDVSLIIGGGLSIEAIPHFLTGISIKILQTKLNFNMGYGWAYLNSISDNLSLTENYSTSPTLKTKKILNGNYWWGLSYQL